MKVDRALRIVLALGIIVLLIALSAALLFVSESALNVWARLETGPAILKYAFVGAFVTAILLCIGLVVRFVVPRRKPAQIKREPLSESSLNARIDDATVAGTQTGAARAELDELARRRADNTVHLCVFGEVSAGKSTLIQALLPGADVQTSPVGGSTVDIRQYRWDDPSQGSVILTDVPGTGSAGDNLDAIAREEALRAHVILYICDGDLTRQQLQSMRELDALGKPTVLALNKVDRYAPKERKVILRKLQDRVAKLGKSGVRTAVVTVAAGGEEEVTIIDDQGNESRQVRARAPDLTNLKLAVREMLARDPAVLADLRDQAVFTLANEKLKAAQEVYRQDRAEALISGYTKKAVIGALAAISPGSDIVIQGYLGTAMTRDLSALWGASVRDMDVEEFLNLSQSRVGKALPLTLAVAGNGLKAFPGIGTVAGGLVHAVAYGLIFDALGRSLAQSLAERGELVPAAAASAFEGTINEHMEKGVRRVAQIALRPDTEHDQ
ncbi:MAG: GTPase [Gammaproteobacteria bacterium]